MKKILILILILLLFVHTNTNNEEMLRIRVIANSNLEYDQKIKEKVSKDLRKELYTLLKYEKSIDNARNKIQDNINTLKNVIKEDLKEEKYGFDINYGLNYFPEKEYKGKKYDAGNYESLVVTLGKGEGDNWWCILFPPICLLEAEESEDIEYSFFFSELINMIFG